jgi:hypothetical protein
VNIHESLANAAIFLASQRQAASARGQQEKETLWRYVRALRDFVHVTGQVYRFEDFLKRRSPTESPHISSRLSTHPGTFAPLAVDMLLETLDETPGPEQKQHVLVLLALLDFIADTGQLDDVEDFFSNLLEYAPVAIAHFASQAEAEAWLKGLAEPPSPAYILIGDVYHRLWYTREDRTHGLYRDYAIEPALEALVSRGLPPHAPSFSTREEAEAWLMSHPAQPYAFVTIAGEHYFAVHHRRLKHHSLHHVASALRDWEERKKAVELETAREAAARADESGE